MKTLFVLLILLLSLTGWTQNRCEYILLSQFFYHLETEKPGNIKEYSCTTYVPENMLDTKVTATSSCIFDANEHALKHNSTCTFNRFGELVKLVCTDPEGNIWEERAYYNNNKCNSIYISKNGSIESMYKICYNDANRPMISRQIVRDETQSTYPAVGPRIYGTGITYSAPHETTSTNTITSSDNFFYANDDAFYIYTFTATSPQNVQMKFNKQGDWTEIEWYNNSEKKAYITERAIAYYER